MKGGWQQQQEEGRLGALDKVAALHRYTTDGKVNANDVLAMINENARVTNANLEVLSFALRLTCATPTASTPVLVRWQQWRHGTAPVSHGSALLRHGRRVRLFGDAGADMRLRGPQLCQHNNLAAGVQAAHCTFDELDGTRHINYAVGNLAAGTSTIGTCAPGHFAEAGQSLVLTCQGQTTKPYTSTHPNGALVHPEAYSAAYSLAQLRGCVSAAAGATRTEPESLWSRCHRAHRWQYSFYKTWTAPSSQRTGSTSSRRVPPTDAHACNGETIVAACDYCAL